MSLITDYFNITKKYINEYGEKTLLLMQVGAFFEVYGIRNKQNEQIISSKICDFAQICELNIVDKHVCVGSDDVVMAGFKDIMIEKYLKKMQNAGFTTVVYTQDANEKNTTRSLAGIFSPGTYFQTETASLTNSIACIWVNLFENFTLCKGKFISVGVANIDIYTGKTTIFEFTEQYINNPTTYDELERFISIYNPTEVILISNIPDINEVNNIATYSGINSSLMHIIHINDTLDNHKLIRVQNCEKIPYQKEIFSKFYNFQNYDVFIQQFNDYNITIPAFCYLLDFVYQHNPQLVNKLEEPIFENKSTKLTLANHSLKQLNIINDGSSQKSKLSSVLNFLNECITSMGKRKFAYNLLNPIKDEIILQREYDITEHILRKLDMYTYNFKDKLNNIKDLEKFERQLLLKKVSPKLICSIFNGIKSALEIGKFVKTDEIIALYLHNFKLEIVEIIQYAQQIMDYITQHFDLEIAKDIDQLQLFNVNFIKSGVDNELDEQVNTLINSESRLETIRAYLSDLIEGNEKKTKTNDFVKIHETEKNNYSLLCTKRRCTILREQLPTIDTPIILKYKTNDSVVNNDSFVFTISKNNLIFESHTAANNSISNPQIIEYCKNIASIKNSIKEKITTVFNNIIDNFSDLFQHQLTKITQFITLIDIIYTKANIANKYAYCKPKIIDANKACVNAFGLRHCLIEQFQRNELYVTNDVSLGYNDNDGILLYGTNAVGKTSLIRALGISVIMAQAGLYVPCSSFKYKPYTHIFTRIIGNDNLFKGLSTFEVEMSELRTIFKQMNENSLILGDELCSGTETVSAISIFVAGIQHISSAKSSFIFATHLHEIVNYNEITELSSVCLKHMSVSYDNITGTLIYNRKLQNGSGNNIYGLEVCKSLNLPVKFLDDANAIRIKYNPESKSILTLKQSRYNSNKLINLCENCGKNMGTEVHHISHQTNANDLGFINDTSENTIFHKNSLGNLITVCETCHLKLHKTNVKKKWTKTTSGNKCI